MKKESIQSVLKELENLPVVSTEGESEEIRRLNFQIQEFKRQEKYMNELIERERIDLSDYINMKMARIDALNEITSDMISKRSNLEKNYDTLKQQQNRKELVK